MRWPEYLQSDERVLSSGPASNIFHVSIKPKVKQINQLTDICWFNRGVFPARYFIHVKQMTVITAHSTTYYYYYYYYF